MSCWSLRLPTAKKAWKTFSSKLQYPRKSKAIKKRKTRRTHFLEQLQLQTHKTNHAIRFRNHGPYYYPFKKKAEAAPAPAPVYIDRLFKEPISAAELVTKYTPIAKDVKFLEQEEAGGTSNNDKEEEACACASAADDMWESLALTSPQMNGIDQRAEKFIQKFREEMKLEEMIARRL